MMSKNPLEYPQGKKFSKDELAEALRYSIIAELDAINLYLQFARATEDERFRKVFEDVAKEEKTHVGEFLALLKILDEEQVRELKAGLEEVREITGIQELQDPPNMDSEKQENSLSSISKTFIEAFSKYRKVRDNLPKHVQGKGIEGVILEETLATKNNVKTSKLKILPLKEISVKFSVPHRLIEYAKRIGDAVDYATVDNAAILMASMEDKFLLYGSEEEGLNGLLTTEGSIMLGLSSWDEPGSAVKEVGEAISKFGENSIPPPYVLFINPKRYSKLIAVHERTGVMELSRIKALVDKIVQIPYLSEDTALLISSNSAFIDVAIGADVTVDYIGLEDGEHVFRAWETLALRVKNPKAIIILKQK